MKAKAKFTFAILASSGVPIYRQIIDQVKTQVATGKLAPGGFLPSVRQVASECEVNPMTVSKAYSLLEKEEVLEYVRGQGMRVKAVAESKRDHRVRSRQLIPLVKDVVSRARQLSLNKGDVLRMLTDYWQQPNDK